MIGALALLLLSQASQPVIITNPTNPTKRVTTTTSGGKETLDVNCVAGCSGSGGGGGTSGDGGYTVVIQGPGADGGAAWGVTGTVSVVGPLTVNIADAGPPINVQGTFFQTTQPVSATNLDVALSTRTKPADQQHTIIDSSASIAVTGPLTDTQLRATPVPVSGTVTTTPPSNASTNVAQFGGTNVSTGIGASGAGIPRVTVSNDSTITANAGTNLNTSALALDATLTGRTAKTQITDGTRDGTVKAASTPAAATDTALVVAISPNNTVPISAASLPLPSGAATSSNQTTLGSSTTKINDGTDTALVSGSGSLQVTCDNCGGSTFLDNGAFTFGTTPVSNIGFVFDDTSPNAVTEDHAGTPRMAANRVPYSTLRDAAGNERGANVNSSNALLVAQTGSLPAGSAVIGHVIADTGSTTAVTGNVTVVQPTGTNLHAVLDTTSTTAVTQATGTNLHAVIDTGSTTAVTGNVTVVQPTGTNLHAVLDATSTTAVTQATASSLNAQVQGPAASGAAKSGNPVQVGAVFNATAPAPTTGQVVEAQADQAGNLRTVYGISLTTLSAWSSATGLNTTQTIFSNSGATGVLLHLVTTSTIGGGAITFEVSYDNSNWVTVPADAVLDPASTSFAQISLPYTLVATTNKPFLIVGKGWQGLRIKLSTVITGTATVTPNYALLNDTPVRSVLALSPTAANFNATVQPGNTANTTPWLVTARVVGNTGATIDAANGGTVPTNVLAAGFEAATQGSTQPTAASAAAIRRAVVDTAGVAFVHPHGPVSWSCFVQAATVMTQCRAAPGGSIRAYVTSVVCDNQAATVQGVDVTFGTGSNCATGTTALTHKFQMGTNATTTSPDHVQGYFSTPLVPTAANAICVRPTAATAFGCTLTGYDAL